MEISYTYLLLLLVASFCIHDFRNRMRWFLHRFVCNIRIKRILMIYQTEIENPSPGCNNKKPPTNEFIHFFLCKIRVQKPKLNYTLENDNTVRIIMRTAVTRGANVLKKKYNSIAFSFSFHICV